MSSSMLVESNSPVANGLDSSQTVMSLAFHLTAVGPTLTDRGNFPVPHQSVD